MLKSLLKLIVIFLFASYKRVTKHSSLCLSKLLAVVHFCVLFVRPLSTDCSNSSQRDLVLLIYCVRPAADYLATEAKHTIQLGLRPCSIL